MALISARLVHLDLKGSPLKVDFLEKVFQSFHKWGATGVLIEWEDTFPYSGRLSVIGSKNTKTSAYTELEVQRIYAIAEENKLSVIPLVQTFGHLEFVLKHPEWKDLREVARYPSSLCPSHPLALQLITEMIDQIVTLAPSSIQFIHIGADEVWHLGLCELCTIIPKHRIFLSHVLAVLRYIRQKYPHLRPIMWDDMMRSMNQDTLTEFNLGDYVEPMIWHYQPANTFCLTEDMWRKYSHVFPNIWIASVYKGASGSCQLLPIAFQHVSNHEHWLQIVVGLVDRFRKIRGIALTGWSRYDHYATLCELLPPALPCLALCLRVLLTGRFSLDLHKSVSASLGYVDFPAPLNPFPRPQVITQELNYPGWKVTIAVEWLANLQAKHASIVDSDQVKTWLNPWQIQNNYTNPMQIESVFKAFKELELEWDTLEGYVKKCLPEVYYDATINEWIGTLILPLREKLKGLLKDACSQLASSS